MANLVSKNENINIEDQKDKYRVTNWSSYNKSLVNRGNITIWLSEEVIEDWYYQEESQVGGQYVYSDNCIECLVGIKSVFKLAYRQLEGFANSIITLLGFELKVPSYTQISRRAKGLEVDLEVPLSNTPIFIVVDSTGLKVYG